MSDNAIGHAITAGLAALVGTIAAWYSYQSYSSASALTSARHVALADGDAEEHPLRRNDWVAVTGRVEVVAPHAPLESLNKDKCAIIEETVQTLRYRWDNASETRHVKRVEVRDTQWALSPGDGGRHIYYNTDDGRVLDVPHAVVERDVVRKAWRGSVSGLSPGGMAQEPTPSRPLTRVAQALMGYVEGDTIRTHSVLPVGVFATVVARVDAQGATVVLRPHPLLGFFLTRDGADAAVAGYRSAATWSGVIAAGFGGLAAWQAWRYLQARYAWLPSLRRSVAVGLRKLVGSPVLPGWESIQRPAGDAASPGHARGGARDGGSRHVRFDDAPLPATAVDPVDVPAEGASACLACQERRAIIVFVPCGHMSFCATCSRRHAATPGTGGSCPMCRAQIQDRVRVFNAASEPAAAR